MSTLGAEARLARSRLAIAVREHRDDDISSLRRDFQVAKLADYVRKFAESAPPLTPAQRDVLLSVFAGIRTGDGGGELDA